MKLFIICVVQLHQSLNLTKRSVKYVIEAHYTPPTIIFRERKNFHSAIQNENETVAEWHSRVKKLALSCKFNDKLEAFVLDRFIMGINEKIFERLCEEDERLQSKKPYGKLSLWR